MTFRILLRMLAFPFIAVIGQAVWMWFFDPTDVWASAVWIPVLAYCWFCIGGLSHEVVHENLPIGNRTGHIAARVIGVLLWIPYSVYREVHMRHHAYLNTPLDWEMWPYTDPKASLRFRRVFVWFDIVLAWIVTPCIWGRICFSRSSPVAAEVRREMKREYLVTALVWVVIIATCVWVHVNGLFLFRWDMLIFAVPPLLATMANGFRKIMDHVGTASFDPLHGTRTIVGQGWVTRALSFFNFDLAIHGPHHRYPKLDHTHLRDRMTEIASSRPDEAFPVFPSFWAAFVDTMKTIVRNPGVGLNAGCQADLSHLPMDKQAAPR